MTLLLLLLYAWLHGRDNAVLYSRKGADAFTWNEHRIFVWQRVVVAALPVVVLAEFMCYILFMTWQPGWGPLSWLGAQLAAFMCGFSYFHNAGYYFTRYCIRHAIDGLPAFKRWLRDKEFGLTYTSPTSTAVNDFDYRERLISMLIGLCMVISHWALFIFLSF